jgi:hypothetical protein
MSRRVFVRTPTEADWQELLSLRQRSKDFHFPWVVLPLDEQVNKFYYKDVLWNGSYFIASCGGVTVSTLRKYIENQDDYGVGLPATKLNMMPVPEYIDFIRTWVTETKRSGQT